ncbi:Ribosomal RNA small subunit methyltransferase F [Candidatus Bilamarchaeum dharawalense]|uniref:Ribosomal RNA small subunit methyltransferase F n=1 Tax=Candidatus Bilamarchaeum dharawalense TaxID=2885759 RepID=A0A5E4LKE9_9ARCH|nr:Ribosomal RNA small subunit methyltransferase F [Candidatus Bilamarchaeum dharawalense]
MSYDDDYGNPEPADPKKIQSEVLAYLYSRFGFDQKLFDNFGLYLGSKGKIYLGPKQLIKEPKIVTLGIMIARADGGIKPTTNLFQIFGKQITKNYIKISKEQAIVYVKGEDMNLGDIQNASDGYVLIKYGDIPLGCGFLKGHALKNMMPKAKRIGLKYI